MEATLFSLACFEQDAEGRGMKIDIAAKANSCDDTCAVWKRVVLVTVRV